MRITAYFIIVVLLTVTLCAGLAVAEDVASPLEKGMSETLDLWREGRFDQLYEHLAHRGNISKESFIKKMQEAPIHPACCWQKMEHFKVLSEKRTEATVYVKIGLEGDPGGTEPVTREFKMTHQDGEWRMQLADVMKIAGTTGKKSPKRHKGKNSRSRT